MGGSRAEDLSANPELLEGKISNLSKQMEKDLDRLKGETATRESSLGQLVQFLQEKRSLMRATPSIWPVKGLLTSNFQRRVDPFTGRLERHMGLDIATNEGVPVVSPADGVVVNVGREAGLGRTVSVDHGFGFATRYGHNSRVVVADGQRVKRGQIIAYVGNTGRSTGPHLHYEVTRNGVPVNPSDFIMN
jgi:murein DD-endopeptidase MepM/ murein hydrolase activator NlpD